MKKINENIIKYPVDAQSDGFICAFVSAILAAQKADNNTIASGNTPIYCSRNHSVCDNCGGCGNKSMENRLHISRYHYYLAVTGVGLLWSFDQISTTGTLDFAMKSAGYNYEIIDRAERKTELFKRISYSVDCGMPVLMKHGIGEDWHVVTGYDTDGDVLYGIDSHDHWSVKPSHTPDGYTDSGLFYTGKWYDSLICAIIITSEKPKLDLPALIEHMIFMLENSGGIKLEREIVDALDDGGSDKHQTAEWINCLAGYTVESRWHTAEAFASDLYCKTDDIVVKELFLESAKQYFLFHDLCWKIWELLGVTPESNYRIADDAGERICGDKVKSELILLFKKLFIIDRNVLERLIVCKDQLRNNKTYNVLEC
ncbi:MAG: hypothetical protein VB118_09825 [Oscillospiraceae bacterium]|nr:hypothetical protein [Oscillospiraceae bacterium]